MAKATEMVCKGYKYRLYPNKEQEQFIRTCCGASRFIYNYALRYSQDRKEEAKANGETYFYSDYEMDKVIRGLKYVQDEDGNFPYEWLGKIDACLINYALRDLKVAYENIKKTGSGFPKYHKKGQCSESYSTQNHKVNSKAGFSIYIADEHHIKLPKMDLVRAVIHRPVRGEIKSATISITPTNKFYVSFLVCEPKQELGNNGGQVGIDVGLKEFYSDSNGNTVANPRFMQKSMTKLKKEQRKLSRMLESHIIGYKQVGKNRVPVYDKPLKDCKNYQKQRIKVAKISERVANQRRYFQDVESAKIARENEFVSMEDLHIQNMQKNHKLAGAIADASWGSFKTKVAYKVQEHGGVFVAVDTFFPSSQTCSVCGYQNKETKNLKIRKWTCPECGTEHDRDVNAGKNILVRGQEILASA